jgi:hypothetical protein
LATPARRQEQVNAFTPVVAPTGRAADIWAWARRQGQEISEQGPMAALVVAAYEADR